VRANRCWIQSPPLPADRRLPVQSPSNSSAGSVRERIFIGSGRKRSKLVALTGEGSAGTIERTTSGARGRRRSRSSKRLLASFGRRSCGARSKTVRSSRSAPSGTHSRSLVFPGMDAENGGGSRDRPRHARRVRRAKVSLRGSPAEQRARPRSRGLIRERKSTGENRS